jgi:hypothetical protein
MEVVRWATLAFGIYGVAVFALEPRISRDAVFALWGGLFLIYMHLSISAKNMAPQAADDGFVPAKVRLLRHLGPRPPMVPYGEVVRASMQRSSSGNVYAVAFECKGGASYVFSFHPIDEPEGIAARQILLRLARLGVVPSTVDDPR